MEFKRLPQWAKTFLTDRHKGDMDMDLWNKDDKEKFSKVIHIAYPNGVYFVVDKLANEGWQEQTGTHYVPETAVSVAQRKAYHDDTPYRVREVVWNG